MYVETLSSLDSDIEKGTEVISIESTKAVAEVYSPVAGRITEFNSILEDTPETINQDPQGDGWIWKQVSKLDDF